MEPQKTVGYIIYKKQEGAPQYLLLHHEGEYWNFPKGRQEQGESELDTARRELQEETGIAQFTQVDGFKAEYMYDFDSVIEGGVREKVHKHAIFFLAEVASDVDVEISNEHIDHGWYDFDQAMKRVYFQNGQKVLAEANKFIMKEISRVL